MLSDLRFPCALITTNDHPGPCSHGPTTAPGCALVASGVFGFEFGERGAQLLDEARQLVHGGGVEDLDVDRPVAVDDAIAELRRPRPLDGREAALPPRRAR